MMIKLKFQSLQKSFLKCWFGAQVMIIMVNIENSYGA